MTKRNKEVPGNTLESQRIFERELMRIGLAVLALESGLVRMEQDDVVLKAIRLAYAGGPQGDVLCIMTATTEEAGVVAFCSGSSLSAVLCTVSNQIRNGSIKWKEDQYANG